MKNITAFSIFGLMLAIIMLSSCYPGGPEYVDEMDLVGTRYDKAFDFSSAVTFMLPDTVVRFEDPDNPDNNVPSRGDYDDDILDLVKQNMIGKGFEYQEDTLNGYPDLVVAVGAVTTKNIGYYWNYWYDYWYWWGYWPPYWSPGWGGGYPWGPPTMYSYTTGTIVIFIIDMNRFDEENNKAYFVWNAAINGLLEGSDQYIKNRIDRGINQAFDQSPYLKSNQ